MSVRAASLRAAAGLDSDGAESKKWLQNYLLFCLLYSSAHGTVDAVLAKLRPENHALALELARVPEQIKGFGHVKARNLAAARSKWEGLMAQWHSSTS